MNKMIILIALHDTFSSKNTALRSVDDDCKVTKWHSRVKETCEGRTPVKTPNKSVYISFVMHSFQQQDPQWWQSSSPLTFNDSQYSLHFYVLGIFPYINEETLLPCQAFPHDRQDLSNSKTRTSRQWVSSNHHLIITRVLIVIIE